MKLKDLIKNYREGTFSRFNVEFRNSDNYFIKEISVSEMRILEIEDYSDLPISEWFIDAIIDNRIKIVILLS